jgi:hypothetical protein
MGLPQREGRPSLDLSPDATPETASWDEQFPLPANKLNNPVPKGEVYEPFHNGWARAGSEEYAFNPAAKKDKL